MIRKKKKRPKPQAMRLLCAFAHLTALVYALDKKGVYDELRKHDTAAGSGEPVDITSQ